jgi:hypothetical protein
LKHLRSWLLKRKGPPSYLSDPHLLQTNQESYTTIQTAEVGLDSMSFPIPAVKGLKELD